MTKDQLFKVMDAVRLLGENCSNKDILEFHLPADIKNHINKSDIMARHAQNGIARREEAKQKEISVV